MCGAGVQGANRKWATPASALAPASSALAALMNFAAPVNLTGRSQMAGLASGTPRVASTWLP